MKAWFTRSNAEPIHNDPSSPEYVPGEPRVSSANYREKCLRDGFARIGWPNTGDLRQLGLNRLAVNGESFETIAPKHQRYLNLFRSILTGDLILTPADTRQYEVQIGVAVLRDRKSREITCPDPGLEAYYYYHDIPNGEWYECSHRVDVLWGVGIHCVNGFNWRLAFSPLNSDATSQAARQLGRKT